MKEFKGSKGKWKRVLLKETKTYLRVNEIHYGEDGECVAEFVHNDFDALLISKAPELLEMLNKVFTMLNPVTDDNGVTESYYQLMPEIEKLIKQSTEL